MGSWIGIEDSLELWIGIEDSLELWIGIEDSLGLWIGIVDWDCALGLRIPRDCGLPLVARVDRRL